MKEILLLADGIILHGKAFGAIGTTTGELCFNTGMTGYQEVFTDPSYYGQVVIMNNVHTGNYGTCPANDESDNVKIKGLIARNLEEKYSRHLATASLHHYLHAHNIIAIHGIDTRALVTHIRHTGAMNCLISTHTEDVEKLKAILAQAPNMSGLELASTVSTQAPYNLGNAAASTRIAVMDYGVKKNILKCMVDRGAQVRVFPSNATLEDIKSYNPHGYFISNGPGDPAAMPYAVGLLKNILKEDKPVFGICLGHQLLALAHNIPTYKMVNGHRGLNHPVKNIITGQCEITTQNHGFGIDALAVHHHHQVEVTHINLNDQSIEGIRIKGKNAFSVQYHPESSPGPHDSRYLFDDFFKMIQATNGMNGDGN